MDPKQNNVNQVIPKKRQRGLIVLLGFALSFLISFVLLSGQGPDAGLLFLPLWIFIAVPVTGLALLIEKAHFDKQNNIHKPITLRSISALIIFILLVVLLFMLLSWSNA